MMLAPRPPASAPRVPPIPMKGNIRFPWSTSNTSTMKAQNTLVENRLITLSQT